ncbi:GTP cyclohydrolase II [Bosea sp. (in: a-proteobacteria)]|uniref:GTP cyclohydrolase II n=1 Tax=Bosea sp. (in: a-proteobacteria) TaxID=1871050 RepID=UPI002734834B|nr:GTP cyclohydrolase II [Bosea sp. (in: a-proteobacteria)]MDP3407216.1 GTP cyclohydrolase II [Bosea sp. (in: a-proteobacteria)]
MSSPNRTTHTRLTSYPEPGSAAARFPIHWGAQTPAGRGPVIASTTTPADRNVIGAHGGSYSVYRALAISARAMNPSQRPDLHNTHPTAEIPAQPQWFEPGKIVSMDPFGHRVAQDFGGLIGEGIDIRPTIAITKARLNLPEILAAMGAHRLAPDEHILHASGDISVTKIAIDPVWHLPGIAERFGTTEAELRRTLFDQTGGMYPELVTRPDLHVFLPPIGSITAYVIGEISAITDPRRRVSCRVHDECNGSDVFGSDICTCRPYLVHGIEEAVKEAQGGGVGLIVYNRKEGRALGEVTKFLVYNARKRQVGGDTADQYFARTECVAGVQDMRFQELMPDVLHWLGITKIHRLVSMSNMKFDAITGSGIEVGERVNIPDELIPADARVEMDAKMAAGYFTPGVVPDAEELKIAKGRGLS